MEYYFVRILPKTCEYCDCCHTKPYDNRHKIDGEKFCGILNEDVEVYYYHGDSRPEFCPLREVPKRTETFDCEELCDVEDWYDSGFAKGWNACIDKMFKG